MSLSTLAVAVLAIGVLAVGVLIVARSSFDGLMIQSGASASDAQTMFDRGVAEIFGIAVGVAFHDPARRRSDPYPIRSIEWR